MKINVKQKKSHTKKALELLAKSKQHAINAKQLLADLLQSWKENK